MKSGSLWSFCESQNVEDAVEGYDGSKYDRDPVSRPRTQSEIEDAAYDVHCLDCGARLGDDSEDWPGDGKRCPECVEVAAELAAEDCAESESCAPTNRTGT